MLHESPQVSAHYSSRKNRVTQHATSATHMLHAESANHDGMAHSEDKCQKQIQSTQEAHLETLHLLLRQQGLTAGKVVGLGLEVVGSY